MESEEGTRGDRRHRRREKKAEEEKGREGRGSAKSPAYLARISSSAALSDNSTSRQGPGTVYSPFSAAPSVLVGRLSCRATQISK